MAKPFFRMPRFSQATQVAAAAVAPVDTSASGVTRSARRRLVLVAPDAVADALPVGMGRSMPPDAGAQRPGTRLLRRWAAAVGVRSLLVMLVVVIVLPFLGLAVYTAQRNLHAEQAAAQERVLTRARLLSARVDDLIGGVDNLLMALTESLSTDPADEPLNNARLAKIAARLPAVYSQLRISDPQGKAIGHSIDGSPDVSRRKYFRDALALPGLAIGEPAQSYRNGLWTVGLARAVRNGAGKVTAVVSITLRLERLHEIIDSRDLPAGSTMFLLSEDGLVMARNAEQERWIGVNVSLLPTGRRALEIRESGESDGMELIHTRDGQDRLTGFAPVRRAPWVAVVASPLESAFAAMYAQQKRTVALFLGAFALALAAGLLAARRIIGPVSRVTADALAFAGGDLARRSKVEAPAEMGVLARTFNRMAEDVAARTETLRAQEARYRAMFESNPQPMWVFDRENLRILAVNEAAIEHYGYTRAEFLAMRLADVRLPGDEPRLHAYMQSIRSGVRAVGVWKHRRKDGTVIDVEVSTHDLMFDGRPAMHSVILDVTERQRMEREVRKLNAELEARVRDRTDELQAINRELEAFTYSVSHDLHNPLRAIDGFSKLLLDHAGANMDAEGRDYLDRIRGAAQRMGGLIGALLALSRVSRGTLRKAPVDLSALAKAVAEELQQAAPRRAVEWRIAPDLMIQGDATLLRSVLANLLGNAWKYTRDQARPVIEFGLFRAAGGMAEFYVRDNGAGFDMAYAGKLFSVFQRLHTPEQFEGNGVGLATVERIIERHGGTVRGEGSPGAGACLYFSLPGSGHP